MWGARSTANRAHSHQGRGARQIWLLWALLAAGAMILGPSLASRPALAQAQPEEYAGVHIQRLRIQVMPEFDDPRVLVIVQGRVAAEENQFPMPVTFRLPKDAQINQMATIALPGGGTRAEVYETRPDPDDGRWLLATYPLSEPHFFYEYYYDPLPASADKDLNFVASSLYPVDDLVIEVQQPRAATGFVLDPAAASRRLEPSLEMYYHEVQAGALPAGGEAAVQIRYAKTDPEPSLVWADIMAAQAARTGAAVATPQVAAGGPDTAGIVAGLGLGTLLAGIMIGWTRLRPARPVVPQSCPGCGAALRRGAQYCHVCGSAVGDTREGSTCVL